MEFQDKMLKCMDCGTEFVFTAGEQAFFHDKRFTNEPKRCKSCKARRSTELDGRPAPRAIHRVETQTTCSHCGKPTTVPFRPTQGRPVLCRDCFVGKRAQASA
jgi:CxxC-x17-CxxC domain-containing protein